MIAIILRETGKWYTISLIKLGDFSLKASGDGLDVRLEKLRGNEVYSKGRIHEWVCNGMVWELESNFVASDFLKVRDGWNSAYRHIKHHTSHMLLCSVSLSLLSHPPS